MLLLTANRTVEHDLRECRWVGMALVRRGTACVHRPYAHGGCTVIARRCIASVRKLYRTFSQACTSWSTAAVPLGLYGSCTHTPCTCTQAVRTCIQAAQLVYACVHTVGNCSAAAGGLRHVHAGAPHMYARAARVHNCSTDAGDSTACAVYLYLPRCCVVAIAANCFYVNYYQYTFDSAHAYSHACALSHV